MGLRLDTGDSGIALPDADRFQIVGRDGRILWTGESDQFAALMSGMQWEPVSSTERRLVSRPMTIEED